MTWYSRQKRGRRRSQKSNFYMTYKAKKLKGLFGCPRGIGVNSRWFASSMATPTSSEPRVLTRTHFIGWSWSFASQGVQIIAQAGAFLLLARSLPVRDIGVFIGVGAVTSILTPFAAMGTANTLIKHVSRQHEELAERWNVAVSASFWFGLLASLFAGLACRLLLPAAVPSYAIMALVFADLLAWRWTQLISLTLQGLSEIDRKSQLEMLAVCARAGAALALFLLPGRLRTLTTWLAIYSGTGVLVAGLSMWRSVVRFGKPNLRRMPRAAELKEGFGFVLSPSTQTVNNDADKFLLAKLADLSATAVYGTAYKILSAAFVPVQALLTVTYPQFFRHGRHGIRHASRFAAACLPGALIYSLAAGVVLFCSAPLVVGILGPSYAATVSIVRCLSVLPVLKAVQLFCADSLTGADFQNLRVGVQGLVAVINILLNVILIPRHGWWGAVSATLISDTLLAFLLTACVVKLHNREQRSGEELAFPDLSTTSKR
jgi:O-antigen/teichoic acid export membrane protein